jgi:hypothetical protein
MLEPNDEELRERFQAMRRADASAAPAWPETLLRSSPRSSAPIARRRLWRRRLALMAGAAVLCGVVAMFVRPHGPQPDVALQLPGLFDGRPSPIFEVILDRSTTATTPVAVSTGPAAARSPWMIQCPSDVLLNPSPRLELFR